MNAAAAATSASSTASTSDDCRAATPVGGHRCDQPGQLVDPGRGGTVLDRGHDAAQQPGRDQAGDRGRGVQAEHGGQLAAVAQDQPGRVPADLLGAGHRQDLRAAGPPAGGGRGLGHESSPRVTASA